MLAGCNASSRFALLLSRCGGRGRGRGRGCSRGLITAPIKESFRICSIVTAAITVVLAVEHATAYGRVRPTMTFASVPLWRWVRWTGSGCVNASIRRRDWSKGDLMPYAGTRKCRALCICSVNANRQDGEHNRSRAQHVLRQFPEAVSESLRSLDLSTKIQNLAMWVNRLGLRHHPAAQTKRLDKATTFSRNNKSNDAQDTPTESLGKRGRKARQCHLL